ncbi:hypothetical protein OIU84_013200 [Salix udensis]|uniref:Synaptonemal complex protein 1 n=1 Tax=Salix udensis TaxID=889485 RepID=A0AAD6NU67_9ROSI|nr:hypothetical protein OIU84_013200 [Salix udensis]
MKTLDQFKSLSAPAKNFSFNSRPSMDSTTSGSFANLKITAEKLVKEQASVKTDLEMANTKLKKSLEHIHVLEDKLQNAFNENAKLKVKQKEDEKLWKGLESKFSSTKTLCDQLTETLQHLAGQVQDAEKDKEFFEGKLSASSNSIDNLNQQLNDLSLKLGSAEETIRTRERELQELEIKKEEREKIYTEELRQTAILIEEKDAMLKKFEAIVAANRLATEDLNSKLEEMNHELRLKGDKINSLVIAQEKLVKEKSDHQSRSNDFANRLAMSLQEIKNLEGFLHVLAAQLVELDKQSLTFTTKFDQLNSLYDSCFKLAQQERELAVKHVQRQYDQLHDQFLSVKSEKDAMKLANMELNDKIIELQKSQESIMAQLSEECQSAKERIQSLESEAQTLMSKKKETELLVSKLEEKIDTLSEGSRSSENKMQDLLLKISALEIENKDNAERLQSKTQRKEEEIDALRKENEKHEQHLDSLEKQVCQLHSFLEEKEQLIVQYKEREKKLEDQITENQASLTAAENLRDTAKFCSLQIDHFICYVLSKIYALLLILRNLDCSTLQEDRQRALLQLQWKVMSDKPQEDPEVNSKKKEYSVSSVKMRAPVGAKRSHNSLGNSQNEKKDSLCLKATQTPVTKLLKKVETPNSGSVMAIPKHHKKVTHHEYEVETNNGRTITKRRKTKSTVMFEDPRKHGRTNTPKARTPRSVAKGLKREGQSHPSTIDDLFLEGSLNPYADDPYAFG